MKKQTPKRWHFNLRTLVEVIAVVMVWRGVWILLDHFLLPANPLLSGALSLLLGLAVLLLDDLLLKEIEARL